MAQEFITKDAMIIAARERSMKNSNGEYAPKVIISLSKGRDVFAPLSTIQNTLDKQLVKSDLHKLVGSTLYYIASNVKAGDTFSFTEGGDTEKRAADNDMEITTIKAVLPAKKLAKHLDKCADYVQPTREGEHEDGGEGGSQETSVDDLKAELEELTNVTQMRAFVQDNDVFDDHSSDFADYTTAEQYRVALTAILDNVPF